jgi:PPK2 family polyphosphate:nucleotide phosphotransferase
MLKTIRIAPGTKVDLADHPTDAKLGLGSKADGVADVAKRAPELALLGAQLAATRAHAVLVVLQGLDAAGKDGAVRHCFAALNPMQLAVKSFKAPSSSELAHDFLWRVSAALPERGQIGIFNRSHYEDVLVVRVDNLVPKAVWQTRYDAINAFERRLVDEGTTVVKLFLHISKDEQAKRLRERLDDPTKNWKYSADDLAKRAQWDDYMTAYRVMLERTSTASAPWYVVPADRPWVRNVVVSRALVEALGRLGLAWPELDAAVRKTRIV